MAREKRKKGIVREYAEAFATAIVLALIIRAFVIQAFKIPSGSMEPTLLIGDHILVNKFIYGMHVPFTNDVVLPVRAPERGNVIVFEYPKDESIDFIKRVIGLPGDRLQIIDKRVYINGKELSEPYAYHGDPEILPAAESPRDNFGPITVPKGEYFMMGDNRDFSNDSRFWGFVDRDLILGQADIIYFSWNPRTLHIRFDRFGMLIH
ncbi:MAG: signal peptidase I [Deltaproteobacteria bacterium]|nr:signal peptidase I [Deltaproteobacteria bacterium]